MNFVRKPWEIIGLTITSSTIDKLNELYDQLMLAWVLELIFSGGESPFDMPDQIYIRLTVFDSDGMEGSAVVGSRLPICAMLILGTTEM